MGLNGELFMNLAGANGMLADGAALDDGFWETAFLNQWSSRAGGRHRQHPAQLPGRARPRAPREPRSNKDQPFSDAPGNVVRPGATGAGIHDRRRQVKGT